MTEDTSRNQKVLVYDLGGGTFDVTVIEVDAGNMWSPSTQTTLTSAAPTGTRTSRRGSPRSSSEKHGTKTSELMDSDETWRELLDLAETAKKIPDLEDEVFDRSRASRRDSLRSRRAARLSSERQTVQQWLPRHPDPIIRVESPQAA